MLILKEQFRTEMKRLSFTYLVEAFGNTLKCNLIHTCLQPTHTHTERERATQNGRKILNIGVKNAEARRGRKEKREKEFSDNVSTSLLKMKNKIY